MAIEFGFSLEEGMIYKNVSLAVKRPDKKASSIIFPEEYYVVDLETTGLSPQFDEIIEISAIKIINSEIVDTFSTLVKPTEEIDEHITRLTGITNGMLENAPDIDSILPGFFEFIENGVIVGHNVNFDINFLYDNRLKLFNTTVKNDFVDTMRIAKKLYPDFPNHKLCELVKNFGIKTDAAHRAFADCHATFKCYEHMKSYIIEKYGDLNSFSALFKKKEKFNAKTITTNNTVFDETHPLYNAECVFTGTLERMIRKDASQIVADLGGHVENSVKKTTDYLILGNLDYRSNVKDGKSTKVKRAEELIEKGQGLKIIPEDVFYDMLAF